MAASSIYDFTPDDDPDDTLFIEHLASLNIEDDYKYPERVLKNMLTKIANEDSRHYTRYGEFVTQQGEELQVLMLQCLRQPVLDLFAESDGLIQKNQVSLLGGNLTTHGRGIYLHSIALPSNKTYWYIGQAYNLSHRISKQHLDFRYRREHPSLHNYAMDRSAHDIFVVLATLTQSTPRPELVLNLLEMWCCLLFKCLPAEALDEWLEDEVYEVGFDGLVWPLNVALPLDSGEERASWRSLEMLKDAEDELARLYYVDVKKGRLRPRASTPSQRRVTASPGALAVVSESNRLFVGILLGVSGTMGIFWARRLLGRPFWRASS